MAGSAKSSKTKNHLTNTQGLSTTSIFDDVLEKQQTIRRISFLFDKCQHYTFCTSGILFHGFCNIRRNYAKWILYDVQSKRWVEYIFIWQYYSRILSSHHYRNRIILSFACFILGRTLLFNSTVILVLVLRYSITKLRELGLAFILPLDNNIYLHKVVGWIIFGQALFHTVMHLCNFGKYELFLHIQCIFRGRLV